MREHFIKIVNENSSLFAHTNNDKKIITYIKTVNGNPKIYWAPCMTHTNIWLSAY